MTYSFHPDAELELNASVNYYQECQDGLGLEFAYEVHKTIQRILEYPTAWQKLDGD
ncbi:MAG: plasmid stabilization protein, partial [Sulfurovum sp. 24-42-9]